MTLSCPLCRLSLPSASLESHLRCELAYFAWRCGRCSFRFLSRADAADHYADRFSPHHGEEELIVETRDRAKHARLEQLFDEALAAASSSVAGSEEAAQERPTSPSAGDRQSSAASSEGQASTIPHLGIDDSESFCEGYEDSEAELEREIWGSGKFQLDSTALEAHTSQSLCTLVGNMPQDDSFRSLDELVSFDDSESDQVVMQRQQDPPNIANLSAISLKNQAQYDFGNMASFREPNVLATLNKASIQQQVYEQAMSSKEELRSPLKTGFAADLSYLSPGHEDPSPEPSVFVSEELERTSKANLGLGDLSNAAAPSTSSRKKKSAAPKEPKPKRRPKISKTRTAKPKAKKSQDRPKNVGILSRSAAKTTRSQPRVEGAQLSQSSFIKAPSKSIRGPIPKAPPPSEYHIPDEVEELESTFGKFPCRLCSDLHYKQNFASHAFNIHMAVKAFACRLCPVQSRVKVTMLGHLKRVHGAAATAANYTNGLPGLREKELPALVRRCFGEESETDYARVRCPACDKIVTLLGTMDHVAWFHVRQDTYLCRLCPFKDNSYRRSKINGHMRTSHRKRARREDVVDISAGPKALIRVVRDKLFGEGTRAAA